MSNACLCETALQLTAPGKGLLASDESTGTIGKRLAKASVENSEVRSTLEPGSTACTHLDVIHFDI